MTDYAAVDATVNVNALASAATPSLSINPPATVQEDVPATFWGELNGGASKNFVPLYNQPIVISVDGTVVTTVNTSSSGATASYQLQLVFQAKGTHTVSAHFPGATVAD